MAIPEGVEAALAAKFQALFPHLDERQRRLVAGAEARSLGHGGIRVAARAAGMREGTVSGGVAELESGADPLGRTRRPGGGRKRLAEVDPGLVPALLALVEPQKRGDPELTGMSRRRLDEMILSLAPALARQREQTLLARRGGRASLNGVAGRAPKPTPAQRILATVLYLRKLATLDLLGELFAVTPMTVSRAVREVRPLLRQHGHQIAASTARFRSPADITRYLARETSIQRFEIKTAC